MSVVGPYAVLAYIEDRGFGERRRHFGRVYSEKTHVQLAIESNEQFKNLKHIIFCGIKSEMVKFVNEKLLSRTCSHWNLRPYLYVDS